MADKTSKLKPEDVKVGVVYACPVIGTGKGAAAYFRRFDRKVTRVGRGSMNPRTCVFFVRRGTRSPEFSGTEGRSLLSSFVRSAGRPVAE